MATEFTTKVRLVRCPKCRLLLPELPDFQVYKCGGCGAVLQAKNRLNGLRSRSTGLNGTVVAQANRLGSMPEDKASSSTSVNGTLSDSGECSSGQINEKNEIESSGESFERHIVRDESKSSKGIKSSSSSIKLLAAASGECSLERRHERDATNASDGIESCSSSPKAATPDMGECYLERNTGRDDSKSSEGIESSSSSPKATFPDSGESFSGHIKEKNQNKLSEDEDSSSLSQKVILPESGVYTSIQDNGRDPDNSFVEDYGGEQLKHLELPSENQNNQSDQNGYGDLGVEPLGVSKEISSSVEFASSESKASLSTTGARSEALVDDKCLPLAPNGEVDIMVEIDSDSTSSSRLNAVATRGSSSIYSAHMPLRDNNSSDIMMSSPDEQSNDKVGISLDVASSSVNPVATRESGVTAQMPAQESSSSGTLTSSPDEQLMEPHNSVLKSFDHLRSSNTFETTEFLSPRSEFSAAVKDRSKSPATRSHHAYDGSVSSYDGTDDQFYNHNPRSFEDAYNIAPNLVQPEERHRREKFLAETMMNKGSELPTQAWSSRSSMSDKNGHAMKYRNRDQEMLPPRIPGHPSRDPARVHREEYMSRMASLQGDYVGGYRNGPFTNQMHNGFQSNIDYQSDRSVSAAVDKMTLLRMVCELQKQVNSLNVHASRQEQHIPQFHNYEASEEELFHGLNHNRDLRSSRAGNHYSQYTRIPFSSEATTSRHQVDPSFMHHFPQDRQYSAPLPQPIRSNTNGLNRVHPGYAASQWDSETMSEDQRLNSHEVKKLYGEKQQVPKRHFRPIAGGAPILICYNCFRPLQIPADFLLFKRQCHRLQCGACSKVLKFSLHNRTHIVPYGVDDIGPPPSEVEEHSYGVNGDPVSCSDDYGYGLSYCKSGSTEAGYAGNVTPADSLQNTIVHERNMSYGSNNPTRGTQEVALRRSQSQNKDKNPVERFMSARTSSNMMKSNNHSSETEKLPPKSSSPLHRLMGYRSPSQVIRGSALSRSGSKSSVRNYN